MLLSRSPSHRWQRWQLLRREFPFTKSVGAHCKVAA
jgi:hypothetical protein